MRKESQTTIKLHPVPEDTYSPSIPSIPSTTTPDEPHLHFPPPSPHTHRSHHHHHHHHQQPKSSIYDTTGSSFSWSTASHEPDPRYDRLLFDYRVIAQSMHAYRHISIFRRFGRLSMANLLYYQDELTCIERALSHVDMEETRWAQTGVSESDSEKQELRETRIKLMKMLQDKLKSYYEALLLQEQIFTSLDPPRPIDSRLLAALEDPSSSPSDSNPFTGAPNSDDLIALGLGGRDSLEKLVGRLVPALFPHRNPSVEDVRHRNLSQKDMASILSPFTRRITRLIIALATTALMLGPMVILQFVTSATWKLVCISLFTVVLALLVALATRGRGEAIVMVVAAYAAVLVVFVQGNQGCGGVVPTIGAGGAGGAGGG
ncbi:hypothetical protein P167DRAFT_492710 [Morchella conica CCBAS932]|uniref:DUF6594 domain-containing protein n=1 Tax=Morchella conica CCBAS932 TaxID=1392247 RepID=A0A3N4KFQ8_9PEZI|nr:hypothetical protein P167DRAFT_492710 [Morchella conica CCBAS932]